MTNPQSAAIYLANAVFDVRANHPSGSDVADDETNNLRKLAAAFTECPHVNATDDDTQVAQARQLAHRVNEWLLNPTKETWAELVKASDAYEKTRGHRVDRRQLLEG